ncbi:MAG: hypothetical protein EXS10_01055 [Phycisphaerales bacterium]|nr:hypothetical protein [Phycisphaerales bacterium]
MDEKTLKQAGGCMAIAKGVSLAATSLLVMTGFLLFVPILKSKLLDWDVELPALSVFVIEHPFVTSLSALPPLACGIWMIATRKRTVLIGCLGTVLLLVPAGLFFAAVGMPIIAVYQNALEDPLGRNR